jgi:hypothetical protein
MAVNVFNMFDMEGACDKEKPTNQSTRLGPGY